jgi:hypothetical protein
MNTIARKLRSSILKVNFEDVPMIEHPENTEHQTKHYFSSSTPLSDINFNSSQLPINYYVVHICENIKYYIQNRNNDLTFENSIKILMSDFDYYTNTSIDEMEQDSIVCSSWISQNDLIGWYYFDQNYDAIANFLDKYDSILRINVYKNELIEKTSEKILHPDQIRRIMNDNNINFVDVNFNDL